MKFLTILSSTFVLLFFHSMALATPAVNSWYSGNGDFKKNIYKGNKELGLTGSLGYSSYSGVNTDLNLSYRYFFADKFSLGPILGYRYNELDRSLELGASGRWYFFESGNWAYSLTQNFVHTSFKGEVPGISKYSGSGLNGLTQLSSNYFFTPSVYMSLSLNYSYNLYSSGDYYTKDKDLSSRIGIGVTF